MTDDITVFDRSLLRRRRDRAAGGFDAHDFLFRETAERLVDRLEDVKRRFQAVADIGCHGGEVGQVLAGRGFAPPVVQCDLSPRFADRASRAGNAPAIAADEELLPFAAASFDLVLSNLSLHWVNDLPGALIQIRKSLTPDGLFIGSLLGGETLTELRVALQQAELELDGGISPRLSPLADVRDAGALLQRAGFALPVADMDRVTVTYSNPMKLLADLRGMGETNVVAKRRRNFLKRSTLMAAMARMMQDFTDSEGRVHATFDIITLTGWAPDASQPKPLRPGSATKKLSEALDAVEFPTDDKAGR
ncbi:MAG: methyltransferase domain-containing protein [Rhodospirillales bacterium]